MNEARYELQTSYRALTETPILLARLDESFCRLTRRAASRSDGEAPRASVPTPTGRRLEIQPEPPWATVYVCADSQAAEHSAPAAADNYFRLWRPPAEAVDPEELSWLRAAGLADNDRAAVLPEHFALSGGWVDPTPADLRDVLGAVRWANYVLRANPAAAAA